MLYCTSIAPPYVSLEDLFCLLGERGLAAIEQRHGRQDQEQIQKETRQGGKTGLADVDTGAMDAADAAACPLGRIGRDCFGRCDVFCAQSTDHAHHVV